MCTGVECFGSVENCESYGKVNVILREVRDMELKGLKTKCLGRNVLFFKSLDSTQTKIKSIRQPLDGTLVIADNQVAGVGTHDRKWYTGNGKNIAMSFVLLPNCNIKNLEKVTICIAKCMVKVVKKLYGIELEIKRPNDLFFREKKVGGILTETVCKGELVKKIYIGIGMNVNQEEFPGNLAEIATSLKREFGKEFDRQELIVEFLNQFEEKFLDFT